MRSLMKLCLVVLTVASAAVADEGMYPVTDLHGLDPRTGTGAILQVLGTLDQRTGPFGPAVKPQLLHQFAEFQLHEQMAQGLAVRGAGSERLQVHRQGHLGLELGQPPGKPRFISMFL